MTDRVLTLNDGFAYALVTAEDLARGIMRSERGYANLLHLSGPQSAGDVHAYTWGDRQLFIADTGDPPARTFELSSRDVILFKRHPEVISARNVFSATVVKAFDMGVRVGVELQCGSEKLVAEITRKAAQQMGIGEGAEIYAAIKALSFRPLT